MHTNEPEQLPLSRRLAEALMLAGFITGVYTGAGSIVAPSAEPLVHVLDHAVPFVAETVWIYLPGYWACFLVAIWAIRDPRSYRAAMTGLATLTLLAVPFFIEWPVAAPRPEPPSDPSLSAALIRWLYANDPAGNTFPSLHVANATLCAVMTTAASRRWGIVAWLLALAVSVSVLTTKQHWAVDVPAGWALATVGAAAWRGHLAAPSVLEGVARRLSGRAEPPPPQPQRAPARRTYRRR